MFRPATPRGPRGVSAMPICHRMRASTPSATDFAPRIVETFCMTLALVHTTARSGNVLTSHIKQGRSRRRTTVAWLRSTLARPVQTGSVASCTRSRWAAVRSANDRPIPSTTLLRPDPVQAASLSQACRCREGRRGHRRLNARCRPPPPAAVGVQAWLRPQANGVRSGCPDPRLRTLLWLVLAQLYASRDRGLPA